MATAGRDATPAPTASDIAAALADAGFVRLIASDDGDAVAATGLLARALSTIGTPFQASVHAPFDATTANTQDAYTVTVGGLDHPANAAVPDDVAASAMAFDVASELTAKSGTDEATMAQGEPNPTLALAGTIAADEVIPPVVEAAEAAGIDRRPGVSVPVTDLADGLARSTLFHAPFSGDGDAASAALETLDLAGRSAENIEEGDWRRIASLVALEASSSTAVAERSAEAVERGLHPYVGGPVETVGGFADVLDATARDEPGVALSLALGHDGSREVAIDAWRDHAAAAHAALADGETNRYDGLLVLRGPSMPVVTVARLAVDFRSPEPAALAITDGEAAIRSRDGSDVASALAAGAERVDGTAIGSEDGARAHFDTEDWTATADDLAAGVREAL